MKHCGHVLRKKKKAMSSVIMIHHKTTQTRGTFKAELKIIQISLDHATILCGHPQSQSIFNAQHGKKQWSPTQFDN